MRISELSAATGVSVPTIKFYVREKLLPSGDLTSRTQAQYSDVHVRRLRLIRALVDVAGLPLERVRGVLLAIDHPPENFVDLLQQTIDPDSTAATPKTEALLERLGWDVPPGLTSFAEVERALNALESVEFPVPEPVLDAITSGVQQIANAEIDCMPTESGEAAVTYSLLGSELVGPLILALRRVGHARRVWEQFERPEGHDPRPPAGDES